MSGNIMALIVFGGYGVVAAIIILAWIFISPEEDLSTICCFGAFWPFALLLLIVFIPFKLLEMLQNKLLELRAKKKYYNENEYRSENEDWYSED